MVGRTTRTHDAFPQPSLPSTMAYRRTEKVRKRLEERRASMLSAARDLFASQGYAQTTMQQVAAKADSSIGNLYFHFKSKEELILAVIKQFVDEIEASVTGARTRFEPGLTQLAGGIYMGVLVVLSSPRLAAPVLVGEGKASFRSTVADRFRERFYDSFVIHLDFKDDLERRLAAQVSQSAVFGLLEHRLKAEGMLDDRKLAAFACRWIIQGLGYARDTAESAVSGAEKVLEDSIETMMAQRRA